MHGGITSTEKISTKTRVRIITLKARPDYWRLLLLRMLKQERLNQIERLVANTSIARIRKRAKRDLARADWYEQQLATTPQRGAKSGWFLP